MPNAVEAPVATAQMLVRQPVARVFEAIVDPMITSRFWFTHGSGPLEAGSRLTWTWAMYGLSTEVVVKELVPQRRVLLEWDGPDNPSLVEFAFEPRDGEPGHEHTFVRVRNWGFAGDAPRQVGQAIGSAGGFSFVLAGLKAWLEHGIELNLIADHDPDAARAQARK